MRKNGALFLVVFFIFGSSLYFSYEKDSYAAWDILTEIIPIPGVSGHEGPVADYVEAKIPGNLKAHRDEMNNVWFTVGEGHPHLLFVAHTDELGLIVDRITESGRLKVKGRGGFFPEMYEAHAVVIHSKEGPVNGVVAPRDGYFLGKPSKQPYSLNTLEIYVGVESQGEVRHLGISKGDSVTIRKALVRLTPDLLCTRAVDDRAGCSALLAVALRMDWTKLHGKTVTFAWDVQEEIGLFGASKLARVLKPDYVFPVDTFVSSDGPFDSKRYAMIPVGSGAVLRAVDSSNIAPHFQLDKVWAIASRNKIPLQIGNTRGGNDGSVFVSGGAANIPLSWPGTYSHSFIEKIHKKDLEALTDLVEALIRDWK